MKQNADSISQKKYAELMKVSATTVHRWMRAGMPHQRLGRKLVRINPKEATIWVLDQGNNFLNRD